jgi:hypothetical protein
MMLRRTNASAMATSPATSSLFSLRFNTFSVRLRFSTCAMYVIPAYSTSKGAPKCHAFKAHSDIITSEVQGPERAKPWEGVECPDLVE